jgi:hypothetical protein
MLFFTHTLSVYATYRLQNVTAYSNYLSLRVYNTPVCEE